MRSCPFRNTRNATILLGLLRVPGHALGHGDVRLEVVLLVRMFATFKQLL